MHKIVAGLSQMHNLTDHSYCSGTKVQYGWTQSRASWDDLGSPRVVSGCVRQVAD